MLEKSEYVSTYAFQERGVTLNIDKLFKERESMVSAVNSTEHSLKLMTLQP